MKTDNSVLGLGAMVCLGAALFGGSGVINMIMLLGILFVGVPIALTAISSSTNLSGNGDWLLTIGLICAGFVLFYIICQVG